MSSVNCRRDVAFVIDEFPIIESEPKVMFVALEMGRIGVGPSDRIAVFVSRRPTLLWNTGRGKFKHF